MANDLPYIPLFVGDFLIAVASWPPERVGAYWLALLYQWEHGTVPAGDPQDMALVLHTPSVRRARKLWEEIAGKFEMVRPGHFQNRRLEQERAQVYAKQQTDSKRGKAGAEARWGKHRPSNASRNAQASLGHSPGNSTQTQTQDQDPPNPPAGAGGRLTREERKWATTTLREWRHTHRAGFDVCPHSPDTCGTEIACVGRLVEEKRAEERRGQQRAYEESVP
ncbi:MAG: hypothetical protein AB7O67_23265 [Vicinamibacterales bacterium]